MLLLYLETLYMNVTSQEVCYAEKIAQSSNGFV